MFLFKNDKQIDHDKYTFEFVANDMNLITIILNGKNYSNLNLHAAISLAVNDYRHLDTDYDGSNSFKEIFTTTKLFPDFLTGRKQEINKRLQLVNLTQDLLGKAKLLTRENLEKLLKLFEQNFGRNKYSFNFKILFHLFQAYGCPFKNQDPEELIKNFINSAKDFLYPEKRLLHMDNS